MATAGVRAELECSVCLNTFTDPVNLTCGHTFCRVCIDCVLDTQGVSGGYSCPECREEFVKRPKLHRNFALRKILDNILFTDQKEIRFQCTYCVDSPVPAVKSCLLCEARLCEKHLNVHSKSPEHVLCDLTTSMESRKCSIHKKILEYYCTEDSACICLMCRIDEAHQRHHVEILDEASENRKKELRNALERMVTMREETEERVLSLQDLKRKSEEKSDGERERVIVLQAERVSLSVNNLIKELETKKDELSRRMRHIEELCNMTDPLTVLQESDSGHLCNIVEGNYKQRCDQQLQGDLDSARVSHTLHKGLSTIMAEVAKMMPASTPFATSSALPLEQVRGTWDDRTGDILEELAGALSRTKITSPQHQLHPNHETEAESCFEQPLRKVEEKESSSEESKEEAVFISVFPGRGLTEEEQSEKVCFEEEESGEVCFEEEESGEVWFGEEESGEVCFEEEESGEVWFGEEEVEEVCFEEEMSQEFYFQEESEEVCYEEEECQDVWWGEEESEAVCFEEDSQEVCFEGEESEEVCFGEEESEEVCFKEEESAEVCVGEEEFAEVCFGEEKSQEVCFEEQESQEVCYEEQESQEVYYEEQESQEVWFGEEESQTICFEEEESHEVWFGEEESQEVGFWEEESQEVWFEEE